MVLCEIYVIYKKPKAISIEKLKTFHYNLFLSSE